MGVGVEKKGFLKRAANVQIAKYIVSPKLIKYVEYNWFYKHQLIHITVLKNNIAYFLKLTLKANSKFQLFYCIQLANSSIKNEKMISTNWC